MSDSEYKRLLHEARGRGAWWPGCLGVMSIGEKIAVALVLNRSEWLTEYGYSIPVAKNRSGLGLSNF